MLMITSPLRFSARDQSIEMYTAVRKHELPAYLPAYLPLSLSGCSEIARYYLEIRTFLAILCN